MGGFIIFPPSVTDFSSKQFYMQHAKGKKWDLFFQYEYDTGKGIKVLNMDSRFEILFLNQCRFVNTIKGWETHAPFSRYTVVTVCRTALLPSSVITKLPSPLVGAVGRTSLRTMKRRPLARATATRCRGGKGSKVTTGQGWGASGSIV